MKKQLRITIMLFYKIGLIISLARFALQPDLTDFTWGFLRGISIVFMAIGLIYMGWCFGKKKNPYNFND
jgi:uncharacterized protein YacL